MKLKPYPEYKDSGVPWLDQLPLDWKIYRAKHLFKEIDRRSQTGDEELLTVSSRRGVVRRRDATVTMFKAESYVGYKLCWSGDLVINSLWAWMQGLGCSNQHGIISSAYGVYRPNSELAEDYRYFDYLLRSDAYLWELRIRSKGIWRSRYQLTGESFMDMPILLPSEEERKRIVTYLDLQTNKINRFIRNKRSLIKLLNEQKQVIINQAVTRGIDSNVTLKPSGISYLGDIPKHWETISLRRIVSKIEQGWSPIAENRLANPDDWGVIKLSAISKGKFLESKHKALGQIPPREKIQIKPGNFLVTRSNTPKLVGEACLVREVSTKLIISDLVYRLSLHLSKVYPEFLNWLWQNPMFRHQISIAAHGSSLSMVKISHQRLLSAILPLPQFKEQVEISEFLQKESQKLDLGIKHAQDEIALIQEYRTRLISDVVTGKIDVRDIEIPALPDEDVVEELDDDALLDAAEAELEAVEDADE